MARFNMNEADNYSTGGGNSFFSLKDDKDTARVRFLYNTVDDIEGYAVHKVAVGDKDRYVNCLRTYNEPLDNCPFCAAQLKVQPKLFLKLYNEDAGECQIWERGKNYYQKMSSLSNRFSPLYKRVMEIERNGKSGDMHTTYEFYPGDSDDANLDDYEPVEPLGAIILDKTFDEMNVYLDTGSFPQGSEQVAQTRTQESVQRRPMSQPSNNSPAPRRRAF